MPIPGALLPEASMLSVADANNADQMILWEAGYGWAGDRLGDGERRHHELHPQEALRERVDGTMVTSPGGVTYKKCPENSSNNVMAVTATYQLPPFVCAQTCDQNPACTSYAVDSAQQNCYIGGPSGRRQLHDVLPPARPLSGGRRPRDQERAPRYDGLEREGPARGEG